MIVSQFYINGNAKQSELVRAFSIQPLALKRWVKRYRASGPKAFFASRRKRRTTPKKSH
jgi:transposase-like protein